MKLTNIVRVHYLQLLHTIANWNCCTISTEKIKLREETLEYSNYILLPTLQ